MRLLLYRTLILLAVIGLILMPPLLTGYAEVQRAETALKANNISLAGLAYERAAYLQPWKPIRWEQAGQMRFKTGEYARAIPLLEKARETGVLSASGWDILGISYWGTEDNYSTAQQIWEEGLQVYPSYPYFYGRLAIVYLQQKNYPAERWALSHWVESGGERDARAHYRYGLLLSTSDLERAQQEFVLASSLNPDYDSVVETMSTALDLASLEAGESSRLVLIGRGLGLVDEWQLAFEAFDQAIAANGKNAEAWAWLGEAQQHLGQDGRGALDKALSLGRQNVTVRGLRALYWKRQERFKQALAEYLLAAGIEPDNPVWETAIGEVYTLLGDLPPALRHYQRATEIAPDSVDAWRQLAVFCADYQYQVTETGLPAARMAVELNGENPQALDTLGWTLLILKRTRLAEEALLHAVDVDPDLAEGHLHLGILYLQIDRSELALEHLTLARDLGAGRDVGEQAQILLNQYFPN